MEGHGPHGRFRSRGKGSRCSRSSTKALEGSFLVPLSFPPSFLPTDSLLFFVYSLSDLRTRPSPVRNCRARWIDRQRRRERWNRFLRLWRRRGLQAIRSNSNLHHLHHHPLSLFRFPNLAGEPSSLHPNPNNRRSYTQPFSFSITCPFQSIGQS